ncbi:glycosyltransferase family 2 protein [Macrococcus carouselicus]|uniref:Putative glycosyltransferase TagX n=1 Tax=Macrococcus carouselicus TaxID=69969 RepID=A0A9Q8FQG1_9STAP|nr:glycosyltransferase [Macrococcus carouselicus]TDM03848.1 glycosyltransferase [Macrococcus carouselicus]
MDKVSIIMPAYNAELFIEDAINSVINQTYRNWELLVIDDCSTDCSAAIIKTYVEQDNRINYIKNIVNSGVSVTRNNGLTASTGHFIAFLDSDDIWQPTKLEKQIALLQAKKGSFSFTNLTYIDKHNEVLGQSTLKLPEEVKYKKLLKHNYIPCSSVVVEKNYLKPFHEDAYNFHEDYYQWLNILKTGVIAYGINEPLLLYRFQTTSKSGNKLKSFFMTFYVFKELGFNSLSAFALTSRHVLIALKKYKNVLTNSVKTK